MIIRSVIEGMKVIISVPLTAHDRSKTRNPPAMDSDPFRVRPRQAQHAFETGLGQMARDLGLLAAHDIRWIALAYPGNDPDRQAGIQCRGADRP